MMARHRLVQRQGLHLPARAGVQRVGVREEVARAARLQGAALIVGGGLGRGRVVGHFDHPVRGARQHAEQLGQLRIGPLGDVAVLAHQVFRFRVIEAGVGAQERQEFLEAALESGRRDDGLHLAPNPRDLGEPDVVDLLWREVRRGPHRDVVGIPGLAIRQVARCDRLPGPRQVFIFGEFEQPFVGRRHPGAIDFFRPLPQSVGLQRVDGRRNLGEALQQRAL